MGGSDNQSPNLEGAKSKLEGPTVSWEAVVYFFDWAGFVDQAVVGQAFQASDGLLTGRLIHAKDAGAVACVGELKC